MNKQNVNLVKGIEDVEDDVKIYIPRRFRNQKAERDRVNNQKEDDVKIYKPKKTNPIFPIRNLDLGKILEVEDFDKSLKRVI